MSSGTVRAEIEGERRRNLEDLVRHARWEAEMVKKMGKEWFRIRDEWLTRSYEADKAMWKDHVIREALIKAIRAVDSRKLRKVDQRT